MAKKKAQLKIKGYMVHITHYDPVWYANKKKEKPFAYDVACDIIDALANEGFNTLMIDIADGVKYKSHPELRRHYTAPMKTLRDVARRAHSKGMDVIPKLNFSRGEINTHNHWMRAPGEAWYEKFEDKAYWKMAFELIDEVIAACKPEKFFHIGMDEDHDRSYTQYSDAIKTLRKGLKERGLRTVIWNDSAINYASGFIYVEKSMHAENHVPKDVVQVLWNYSRVPAEPAKRIAEKGFELWGSPTAQDVEIAAGFRDAVLDAGGKGLMMTRWIPCIKENRKELLEAIHRMGPVYRNEI